MYALCVFGAVSTQGFVWNFCMRYIYIFIHSFIQYSYILWGSSNQASLAESSLSQIEDGLARTTLEHVGLKGLEKCPLWVLLQT